MLGAGPEPIPPSLPSAKAPSPPSNNNLPYQRPDIKIPENPMGLLRKTGGPNRPAGPFMGSDEEQARQQIKEPPMKDLPLPSRPLLQQPQPMIVQAPEPQSPSGFKSVQPPQQVYKPTLSMVQPVVQSVKPKSAELKSEGRAQV